MDLDVSCAEPLSEIVPFDLGLIDKGLSMLTRIGVEMRTKWVFS